jgi:hypothetical protein
MKSFVNLTLEELLEKEILAESISKGKQHIAIYKRIAELYKQSNDLQKESEYLTKASEIEETFKK